MLFRSSPPSTQIPIDLQSLIDTGGPWQEARLIGNCLCLLGDCREILPVLPKVDLLLTDPPYGIKLNTDNSRFSGGHVTSIKKRANGVGSADGKPIIGDNQPFDPSYFLNCAFSSVIWGWNHFGILGLGDTIDRSSPVQVGLLTDWKQIVCGDRKSTRLNSSHIQKSRMPSSA